MQYFGKSYAAEHYECGPTPIGEPCSWCSEIIIEGDQGFLIPSSDGLRPVHHVCFMREVLGSVGHQTKQCSCYGGTFEDPPEMTKREAAQAAVDLYTKIRG